MKKILALAIAVLFAAAAPAFAGQMIGDKPLIEKLKEKGVLTDDDIKAINGSDTAKIEMGGRFQTQYKNVMGDNTAASPVTDTLFIRRARLEFKAQISPIAFVKIEPEFGQVAQKTVPSATTVSTTCTQAQVTAGTACTTTASNTKSVNTVYLEDAYIGVTPGFGEFDVGNHYVPFSLDALTSDKKIAFVERNLTASLAPYRQVGVSWQNYALDKVLFYQLGIFNGYVQPGSLSGTKLANQIYTGNGAANDNNKYLYSARIELHPLGNMGSGTAPAQENFEGVTKFAIGASYYTSDDAPATGAASASTEKASNGTEIDAQFKAGGFWATAEYILRDVKYWDAAAAEQTANQSSYTVQAGYMLVPDTFSLALRYEYMKYDGNDKILGSSGQNEDKWITVGLNYYLLKNNIRIQANYIQKGETMPGGGTEPKNDTILAMMTYHF
ncbi:MAG: hypothetical protein HZA03_04975 [Nitrospinae bacterium]|nr:hypothetical protein [Nitrospinota bacterium]